MCVCFNLVQSTVFVSVYEGRKEDDGADDSLTFDLSAQSSIDVFQELLRLQMAPLLL